jgi:hypothetical protein
MLCSKRHAFFEIPKRLFLYEQVYPECQNTFSPFTPRPATQADLLVKKLPKNAVVALPIAYKQKKNKGGDNPLHEIMMEEHH